MVSGAGPSGEQPEGVPAGAKGQQSQPTLQQKYLLSPVHRITARRPVCVCGAWPNELISCSGLARYSSSYRYTMMPSEALESITKYLRWQVKARSMGQGTEPKSVV